MSVCFVSQEMEDGLDEAFSRWEPAWIWFFPKIWPTIWTDTQAAALEITTCSLGCPELCLSLSAHPKSSHAAGDSAQFTGLDAGDTHPESRCVCRLSLTSSQTHILLLVATLLYLLLSCGVKAPEETSGLTICRFSINRKVFNRHLHNQQTNQCVAPLWLMF